MGGLGHLRALATNANALRARALTIITGVQAITRLITGALAALMATVELLISGERVGQLPVLGTQVAQSPVLLESSVIIRVWLLLLPSSFSSRCSRRGGNRGGSSKSLFILEALCKLISTTVQCSSIYYPTVITPTVKPTITISQ